MPKKRKELKIETLERMVQTGQKKFVSYNEGKDIYSVGLHTFQEIAGSCIGRPQWIRQKIDDVGGVGTAEFASKAIDTFYMSRR